jgi:hypothetical protein
MFKVRQRRTLPDYIKELRGEIDGRAESADKQRFSRKQ